MLGAVGMADHAGGGVGEIAYVAAFDVHAFAAAYIGHVQLDVLRGAVAETPSSIAMASFTLRRMFLTWFERDGVILPLSMN